MFSLFPIYVEFPLTDIGRKEAISLVCLRRVGAMDTARLIIDSKMKDLDPHIAGGSPLHITWESEGKTDHFYGYVHSYQPIVSQYSQKTVIIAVSAAYPMFNASGRTYYQAGIHNVADDIANDYRFQADIEPHSLVHEQVLQMDDSDWELLQRLANRWGYIAMMDGVTLIFRPLDKYLEDKYLEASRETSKESLTPKGSNLIEFSPNFSAVGPVPVAANTGQGMNPNTINPVIWQQPGTGVFSAQNTAVTVTSELEGELTSYAMAMKNRFPFTAKAVILAPLGKKPLDIYQIKHQGKEMTWAISSIRHYVSGAKYFSEVLLGTDGTDRVSTKRRRGAVVSSMLNRHLRTKASDPMILNTRPYFTGAGGSSVISDQRWKASVTWRPAYAQEADK